MKKYILAILGMFFIFIGFFMYFKNNKSDNIEFNKIKSINLATDYNIEQVLKDIELVNANTVNVPVVINIPSLSSNEMGIDEYSKNKAIELIQILNEKDINIILEAYPWIENGSKYETEYNPEDKEKFFDDWKNILTVLINDIGNKYNVDVINTASNFDKLESYEDEWCSIIDYTKAKFDGLVTYKTTWWYSAKWDEASIKKYEDKLNNKIFSKVDFISIAAYFELSDKPTNSVEELVECLKSSKIHNREQNIKQEIENFYNKYNKDIFFGELGFPRRNNAATHPWDMAPSQVENNEEQARCFEAYKLTFEGEKYFKGFSVFAMGEKSEDKNFYPSKESIEVLKNWN